jgi:hypothetical protein
MSMNAKPAEPPAPGAEEEGEKPAGAEGKPKPESSEPPAEGKAKEEKKTEKSMTETTTEGLKEISKPKADGATGHTPDPAGSGSKVIGDNKELKPEATEKPVPGETSEKVGSSIPTGAAQGSPIKKDEIPVLVKKPEKGDVIKMLKDRGHVVFKVDTRAPVTEKHPVSGAPVKKEEPKDKPKTITQVMKENRNAGFMTMRKPKE